MSEKSAASPEQHTSVELAARLEPYPPPYPEGWYVVAKEADIGPKPMHVRVAGNDIVVFRGAENRVHAIDAYCPHMGANLAGGCVKEGQLVCPFHNWRLDGDGQVTFTREGERYNPNRRVASWAVDDVHGWICIFHRHGELGRQSAPKPPYQILRVPEIDSGELIFRGEHDEGIVNMHLIEFAENSVDVPHFDTIHGKLLVPWTNIPVPGFRIHHVPSWQIDEAEPHVAWFGDDAQLEFRGKLIEGSGAKATIRIDGPGGLVRFEFDLGGKGRVVMYQSHTPVGPLEQHVRFRWWSERRIPKLLASYIVGNWVTQWRQDVPIWEQKIYRPKPMLTESDGPVMKLRRWYSQFYPNTA
jgi:cholesterol 7-dehydrogenase